MARPRRPVRNKVARSWFADVRRFLRLINTDEVLGTHRHVSSTNGRERPCNLKPQQRDSTPVLRRSVELAIQKQTKPGVLELSAKCQSRLTHAGRSAPKRKTANAAVSQEIDHEFL